MSKTNFSKRQLYTAALAATVNFFMSSCVSLQAPFYPQEAERKGATATEYGLVFGIYELVAFISSPYFGRIVERIGVKLLLGSGMAISSIATIMFGFLDLISSRKLFISLSFVLRIFEALGASAASVSSFTLIGAMFPDNFTTVFAILEIFYGTGYVVGPSLGGLLYSFGGYSVPFIFLGVVTALVAVSILLLIPNVTFPCDKRAIQGQLSSALKIPSITLDALCVVSVPIGMGFYNTALEPHIRIYGISPIETGLMFTINGGTYALISPLFGFLVDRFVIAKEMIIFGSFLCMVSFSIVGPLPFLPIPSTLTSCVIALFFHGLSMAAINVGTFSDSIRSIIDAGFPETVTTYGIISGIWLSSFSFGAFVGPSIAGILLDMVGFQKGTFFVIITNFIILILMTTFIIRNRKKKFDLIDTKLHEKADGSYYNDNILLTGSRSVDSFIKFSNNLKKNSYSTSQLVAVNENFLRNGYGAVQIYEN